MLELNFNPFPVLETERLLLRQVTMDDAPDVLIMRSDINAMKYIGKPISTTLDDARDLIGRIEDGIESNTAIGWGISLKNNHRFIGTIGFHRIDTSNYRAEIGYMLLPEFWNKGVMSEAMNSVLDYGFKTLKFHSIFANIDPDNLRSAAILKKFNFVKEAYFKENFYFNGKFTDTEIYSLLNKAD